MLWVGDVNGERLEDSLRRNYEVRVEDQLLLSIIIMHVREARTFQNMYEFTEKKQKALDPPTRPRFRIFVAIFPGHS